MKKRTLKKSGTTKKRMKKEIILKKKKHGINKVRNLLGETNSGAKKTILKKKSKKINLKIKKIKLQIKKSEKNKPSSDKTIKVKTGIINLDDLTEGGFEKNSTNLIVGGAGSGKTILAMQFLAEGLKKGEKCLYVTFEEKKEQFYKHMSNFGWNLDKYEKNGLFTFLEYAPIKVKTMLEEGGGAIESIILRNKISRMVIDSITSFALLFERELEKKEAALQLFNMTGNWNCTSLLTLEEDQTSEREFGARTLEFEADSIILLYYIVIKGQRQRYLEILKMRGTKHSNKIHKFEITKKGVSVQKRKISRLLTKY